MVLVSLGILLVQMVALGRCVHHAGLVPVAQTSGWLRWGWRALMGALLVMTIRRVTALWLTMQSPGLQDWLGVIDRALIPGSISLLLWGGIEGLAYGWRQIIGQADALIYLPHPAGFTLDAQSVVLAWDAGAVELFGWSAEEAIGQTIMHLITPDRSQGLHVPLVQRYLQVEPATHPTVTYALHTRWRDTAREFHAEVLVTAVPQGESGLQFQCVARELVPAV